MECCSMQMQDKGGRSQTNLSISSHAVGGRCAGDMMMIPALGMISSLPAGQHSHTVRSGSTAQVLAKCKVKSYRISECHALLACTMTASCMDRKRGGPIRECLQS